MAHLATQPGLHAHSVNPDRNLMKQFTVWEKIPDSGWLAITSFGTLEDAEDFAMFDDELTNGALVRITNEWSEDREVVRFIKGGE